MAFKLQVKPRVKRSSDLLSVSLNTNIFENALLGLFWTIMIFFLAYTRPFVLGVITDENDGDPITNEKGNRGFNLLYSQLPCANLG